MHPMPAKKQPERNVADLPPKKVQAKLKATRSPAKDYTEPLLHKVATKIVVKDPKYIPQYKTDGAACVDLYACIPANEQINLTSRSIVKVSCGFSMELQPGYKALISARSGLAAKGLIVTNGPGVIDSDYRGEVCVILSNVGKEIIPIKDGDRIAQMSIEPVYTFDWIQTDILTETTRGTGGFGSTGV